MEVYRQVVSTDLHPGLYRLAVPNEFNTPWPSGDARQGGQQQLRRLTTSELMEVFDDPAADMLRQYLWQRCSGSNGFTTAFEAHQAGNQELFMALDDFCRDDMFQGDALPDIELRNGTLLTPEERTAFYTHALFSKWSKPTAAQIQETLSKLIKLSKAKRRAEFERLSACSPASRAAWEKAAPSWYKEVADRLVPNNRHAEELRFLRERLPRKLEALPPFQG